MLNKKPIIGITLGEPKGIGSEVVTKALLIEEIYSLCFPIIFGSKDIFQKAMEEFGLDKGLFLANEKKFRDLDLSSSDKKIHIVDCQGTSPEEKTIHAIQSCTEFCLKKDLNAMVTGPIDKHKLQTALSSDQRFIGHTEFLQRLTHSKRVAMMLAGEELRVVPVTIHCSLKEVAEQLSLNKIFDTIELTAFSLKEYFRIGEPRIAVSALNPHAGEKGLFGREEEEMILPAVEKARLNGIDVQGPISSDTLFYKAVHDKNYDAVITMYHDQALIPLKMLYFHNAVNITLGLPIIRTSVDHGTAYEIVGKNQADPSSMVEAIRMAAQFCRV